LDRLKFRYLHRNVALWKAPPARCWARTFSTSTNANYIDKTTKQGTAFFCTSAYVNHRSAGPGARGLLPFALRSVFSRPRSSSSAFPAAFAARSEAMSFRSGSVTNLSAMRHFRQSPFIPAISLLKDTQKAATDSEDPRVSLRKRLNAPDLISRGLRSRSRHDTRSRFASGSDVSQRAAALAASVKPTRSSP